MDKKWIVFYINNLQVLLGTYPLPKKKLVFTVVNIKCKASEIKYF